jgi:hypothetical protein
MGWSHRDFFSSVPRCVQRKCFIRGKRFSILPIITLDGIIAHDIIEGSVMSEQFVEFLHKLVVCGYALAIQITTDRTLVATN